MRGVVLGALLALGLAPFAAGDSAAQPKKATDRVKGLHAAAWAAVPGPTRGPAQAIGGYAAGCLAGGVALPGEGTGYQAIRLSRQRNYGHPALVDFVRDFGRRVATAGLGTALVGDMGQARGGPLTFGHASHQIGLDVDVWLRLDLPPMGRAARERLEEIKYVDYDAGRVDAGAWTPGQGEMIRIAATDPRVARIFVHPAIKLALCERRWPDRAWLRKVRPWYGHDGHMHVRLGCPPGSPQCEEQKELPPGEGCDDDLHNWIRSASRPVVERSPAEAKPPRPVLPAACQSVLRGTTLPVVAAR